MDTLIKTILINALSNSLISVLLVGSRVWGRNSYSDYDLEIIIKDDFEFCITGSDELFKKFTEQIEDFSTFLKEFKRLYEVGDIDYGSHKLLINQTNFSLHFIPLATFKKVCTLDLTQVRQTRLLREYRLYPKEKGTRYIQRNFRGDACCFQSKVKILSPGRITLTPLAIIRNNQYFMGLLPDKYLTSKILLGQRKIVSYFKMELFKKVIDRLNLEKEICLNSQMSILFALHKNHLMPISYKRKISQKEVKFKQSKFKNTPSVVSNGLNDGVHSGEPTFRRYK